MVQDFEYMPDPMQSLSVGSDQLTFSGLIRVVQEYYGLGDDELVERNDLLASQARGILFLLAGGYDIQTPAELAEYAGCTDSNIRHRINDMRQQALEEPALLGHAHSLVQAASANEPLTNTPGSWADRVAVRYHMPLEEIRTERTVRATEARGVLIYLIDEHTVITGGMAGLYLRLNSKVGSRAVGRIARQRAEDPSLDDFIQQIEAGVEVKSEDEFIDAAMTFYDTDQENLNPTTTFQAIHYERARLVLIYLLMTELRYPRQGAREYIGYQGTTIIDYKSIVEQDKNLMAEIDYIRTHETIDQSLSMRIIRRVSDVTGIGYNDMRSATSEDAVWARKMAIALLAERGHLSLKDIAGLFYANPQDGYTRRAARTIAYHQIHNARLRTQMEWIRQNTLVDDPSPLTMHPSLNVEFSPSLPDIPDHLVAPAFRDKVYAVLERVAEFYNLDAGTMVGREQSFELTRARRAAVVLLDEAHLILPEVGICFGGRTEKTIESIKGYGKNLAAHNHIFREELLAIKTGGERRDMAGETLQRIEAYYNVSADELHGQRYWPRRASAVFIHLMQEYQCVSIDELARQVQRAPQEVFAQAARTARQLETDRRLRQEVAYLKDPQHAFRPLSAPETIDYILGRLQLTRGQLRDPDIPANAKKFTVFVLRDELSLPASEISISLGLTRAMVNNYIHDVQIMIAANSRQLIEIDMLRPPGAVNVSSAGKILASVAKRFGIAVPQLVAGTDSHWNNRAQAEAVRGLAAAGYDANKVAQMLDTSKTELIRIIRMYPANRL